MAAASEDDGDRLRSQDLPFGVIPDTEERRAARRHGLHGERQCLAGSGG
jgi:hypothetical protein